MTMLLSSARFPPSFGSFSPAFPGAWPNHLHGLYTMTEIKQDYYPVWEYYGRRSEFGALPAVTTLAGPEHRRCNYNLDLRGKNIQLRAEDPDQSPFVVDCGLDAVKTGGGKDGVAWLDFPRRGILMVSGEGRSTVVGPGVVVQHCGVNRVIGAEPRSHPSMKFVDWYRGGGFLVANTASSDGPTLVDVTIRNCGAHKGGGIYAEASSLTLQNVSISQCGRYIGPAVHTERNVTIDWSGGRVKGSASHTSGAVMLAPYAHVAKVSFRNVTFESNVQEPSGFDPGDKWRHSGAVLAVDKYASADSVEASFRSCSFLGNVARQYGGVASSFIGQAADLTAPRPLVAATS